MNRLLRDILFQVRGAQDYAVMETSDLAQLVNALREFLRRKRYIIMINDLWSTEEWNMIRYALPENDLGSRILVTTRVMDVAFSCCNHERGYVYKLKPLSVSDSRELFLRRIFGSESKGCCPEDLYGISEEILKICEGLPLAITTVCGLLASRSINILVWMRIKDSIRSNIEKNDSYAGMIISILNVCYAHLPIYLKPCLLYLSMFPEDNVIDRKRLVRRWMAEGFIRAEHGKSLEEVGDYYFSELVNSGLIQPLGIQYDDQLYACQVHDVILDFILQRSLEDNFVVRSNDGFASRLQDKVRRLFLDCRDAWNTFTPSEITTFHVRSLTVIGSNRQMPSLASFRALRVLDLENSGQLERNYFQGIGRLYLLKYLRLQTPSVIQLPEEMGKLVNLETLDLAGAPKSKLPNSIIELKKLIYFLANNVNIPNRFGSMLSLQEVSCVQIDSSNFKSTLHELEKLTVLTVLGLNSCIGDEDTDMKDTLVSFLSKVIMSKNIKSLYIESADCYSLDFLLNIHSNPCYHLREFHTKSNYFFQTVPEWICTVFNLTTLRINIEILGEEVLHILGGLQSLEALILMVNSTAPEQGLIIRSNEFRCLKQFDFTCWNSLGVLKFETGAMKNLQKLRAVFSRHGGGVANDFLFSIEHLTSLKHVVIEVKCEDVKANEVKTVVDAVNGAVRNHPNNPIRLVLKAHAGEKAAAVEREIAVHGEEGKNQNEEHEVVIEAESTSATN